MSEHLSDDARREAARKRLQERQAREQAESAGQSASKAKLFAHTAAKAPADGSSKRSARGSRADSTATSALSNAGGKIASIYASLCEKFGKRNTLIGIVAAIVVFIAIVFGIRACATPADPVQQALGDAERAVSTSSYANDDGSKPIQSTLVNLIGSEEAANLLDAASSSEDVYWIASHPDSFLADGDAVQAKLLKLAANEPEAASFVRNWPDKYPQDAPSGDASTPSADSGTNIPRLYQWDERWGYTVYSSTTFALTGCCPTSLAMVYQGLTGNTDKSPYDMGQLARNGGYETQYDGTDGTFLLETADQLGLSCTQLTPIASNITSTLSSGKVLIINVGPGDFTTSGHYIVACGLDDDGNVIINDPYSAKRSEKTWDVSTLVDQAKAIYAYSA